MLPLTRLSAEHDHATVGVLMEDDEVLPLRAVLGIGRNYLAHASEQGVEAPDRPMIFSKNCASCCLDGDTIVLPSLCEDQEQVDYEGELAVILKGACRNIDIAGVLDDGGPVLGFCCANDVSARWWQREGAGGQFWRGKSFDTFCPLGPGVVTLRELSSVLRDGSAGLQLETRVNGDLMQSGHTNEMAFSVSKLISELSRETTLLPGTVILTGTPSGVGMARNPPVWLRDGDTVEVEIESIGTLRNTVRSA